MIRKALIAAIVASVSTAAWGQVSKPSTPRGDAKKTATKETPDCPADATECKLTVKVSGDCVIKVEPKERYVVAPHKDGVAMVWTVDGKDAKFAKNGIEFKTSAFKAAARKGYTQIDNPKGVFTPLKIKAASETEFPLKNSGKPGQYYYVVNVIQGKKACDPYDPGVVNQ